MIKGLVIVGQGWIAPVPLWVPDDIESCSFQNLLVFGFSETSQNLSLFRQLLFSFFFKGPFKKTKKNNACLARGVALKKRPNYIGTIVCTMYILYFKNQFWQIGG